MFADSSVAAGVGVLAVVFLLIGLVAVSLKPTPCQVCLSGEDRPALEHDRDCSLRLAFYGGQPHWDQDELQVQNDVVFYFDKEAGTWRPQLWDYENLNPSTRSANAN